MTEHRVFVALMATCVGVALLLTAYGRQRLWLVISFLLLSLGALLVNITYWALVFFWIAGAAFGRTNLAEGEIQ